ncbi:MAG: hypothetical protein QXJ73_07165 [Candidatus Caldarchaeum sp.]
MLTIPEGFTGSVLNMTMVNRVNIMQDTILRLVQTAGEQIPEEMQANITASMQQINMFKQSMKAERKTLMLEGSPDDRILQPIEGIINIIASKFETALLNASSTMAIKLVYSEARQLRAVDYYLPGYIAAFIMTNGLIGFRRSSQTSTGVESSSFSPQLPSRSLTGLFRWLSSKLLRRCC